MGVELAEGGGFATQGRHDACQRKSGLEGMRRGIRKRKRTRIKNKEGNGKKEEAKGNGPGVREGEKSILMATGRPW